MIHYTCDRCQKKIETEREPLFQVRIEVVAVHPPQESLEQDEQAARELLELEDLIDEMAVDVPESNETEKMELSFDLCPDCFQRFTVDPLARSSTSELGFSQN